MKTTPICQVHVGKEKCIFLKNEVKLGNPSNKEHRRGSELGLAPLGGEAEGSDWSADWLDIVPERPSSWTPNVPFLFIFSISQDSPWPAPFRNGRVATVPPADAPPRPGRSEERCAI